MIFIILYKVLVVILIKDLEGLEKYYRQLLQDCNRINNLTALSPTVINNPAIYNNVLWLLNITVLMKNGIQINLGIFMDLNDLEHHLKIYEFTKNFRYFNG